MWLSKIYNRSSRNATRIAGRFSEGASGNRRGGGGGAHDARDAGSNIVGHGGHDGGSRREGANVSTNLALL